MDFKLATNEPTGVPLAPSYRVRYGHVAVSPSSRYNIVKIKLPPCGHLDHSANNELFFFFRGRQF